MARAVFRTLIAMPVTGAVSTIRTVPTIRALLLAAGVVLPPVPAAISTTAHTTVIPQEGTGIVVLQDTSRKAAYQDTSRAVARQDTLQVGAGQPTGAVEDSLTYGFTTAESDGTIATLRGSPERPAWARYKDIELKAGIIIMDFDNEMLTALPLPDTTAAGDGGPINRPIFHQGDQTVVGDRMAYDLVLDRGSVWGANTEYEMGYYHGQRINAIAGEPDYLTVRDAWFTTCDKEEKPHYYFAAEKMKIIPTDKVVAKGIRMHILGIPIPPPPLPAFPFLIKSIRSGRQSGLLMPQYSSNSLTGLTLKDLGFYWAPSEYFDARLITDVTELRGIVMRGRARYALRYRLQGNIEATYNYDRLNKSRRWETRFNHSQQVSPTLRIVAQGNFSSTSEFNKILSDNLERRLQRILRSHMNLSKRFGNGSNLAVTLSQTRYLDTDVTNSQFPSMTFRLPRRPLFGSSGRGAGQDVPGGLTGFGLAAGGRETEPAGPVWYENFYIDYNMSLRSNIRSEPIDPQAPAEGDTTITQAGVEQRANLSYSGKVLGWLNLQPSFSAREDWYVGSTAQDDFQRRLLWRSSLRASTKLYGMADRPFGINASFRHVVEPSLSVNYEPDFSDRPAVPGSVGGNPRGQQSLSFSLGQIFQMKRQVGEQERKLDLARVTTSGSYNAKAIGRKLSDVRTSLVTNAGRVLNLQMNVVHRFYAPGIDRFQWTPVTESASYRSSLRLDSATVAGWLGLGRRKAGAQPGEEGVSEEAEQQPGAAVGEEEVPFGVPTRETGRFFSSAVERVRESGRRWNLTLGHNYAWTRGGLIPRHSLDGSLTVNVPKWTLTWSARYDVAGKELVRQSFSIYRDLHCWEARLQIVPTGPGSGYWFVISIKEIPEIKYERRQTVF